MDVLSLGLRNALFAHWPADPTAVTDRLPDGVSALDHEGRAWLGVVMLRMTDVRPRGTPRRLGRSLWQYNLRTYVSVGGRPGVYFFSLDADDRLSATVARRLFRLPYHRTRIDATVEENTVSIRGRRVSGGGVAVEAAYRSAGDPIRAPDRNLTAFLLERYRWYAQDERGRLWTGRIDHDPWTVAPAEARIEVSSLFEAAGIDPPSGDPRCHVAAPCPTTAGPLWPV